MVTIGLPMKDFAQSGEWALTIIAPAGGVVAGAIAKVGPATGIVSAAGTKSIGWIVAAGGARSATARVRVVARIDAAGSLQPLLEKVVAGGL